MGIIEDLEAEIKADLDAYYWDPIERDYQCYTFFSDDVKEVREEKKLLYEKFGYKSIRGWYPFKTASGIEAKVLCEYT